MKANSLNLPGSSWLFAGVLMLCGCGPADSDTGIGLPAEGSTMHISGNVGDVYETGRFALFIPPPKGKGTKGAMTSMSPATSNAERTEPRKTPSPPGTIGEAVVKDGKFELSIDVDEPKVAYFYVLDGLSKDGMRMGAVKGQSLILEPGDLKLNINSRGRNIVTGGRLNDIVYNSWRLSSAYLAKFDEYHTAIQPVEGESEQEVLERMDGASDIFSEVLDLETSGRTDLALNHEETLVRKLVIQSSWMVGDWTGQAVEDLAKLTPEDPWVQEQLIRWRDRAQNKSKQAEISSGGKIIDFTASSLDGETIQLAQVRAESEVVLVEFWASWCGPCRTEIPHLKTAFEKYKGKGFQIVSFTIDKEREAWEEASLQEELPWHDLGMGENAEAPQVYGVTGVPKNYLVDSKSGRILAEDLRGLNLDRKLKEIFGEEGV